MNDLCADRVALVMTWHPWRHLREHHPDMNIHFIAMMPGGVLGRWNGAQIICIDPTQSQVSMRCTLTHELIHVERGLVSPEDLRATICEERVVDMIAAQRLIPMLDLLDALRWSNDHDEIAEELRVDGDMLRVRLEALTVVEHVWLNERLVELEESA